VPNRTSVISNSVPTCFFLILDLSARVFRFVLFAHPLSTSPLDQRILGCGVTSYIFSWLRNRLAVNICLVFLCTITVKILDQIGNFIVDKETCKI
jgi:hypothetical protein